MLLATVTDAAVESAVKFRLSVTRAVTVCAPSDNVLVSQFAVNGVAVAMPITEPSTRKSTRITPLGAVGVAVNVTLRLTVEPNAFNVTLGAPALVGGHGGP
jgi:hypothetical protein